LTKLLEDSAAVLSCGPSCQKQKLGDDLKQKYLDAQSNIQRAPTQLENSKKNYYVFTEGEPYYDNMLEEELKQKSDMITQTLAANFNDEISNAKTMNSYYNTELENSSNTNELYKIYLVKNKEIQDSIKGHHGDVITNDRKTYYETEALEKLQSWYTFYWYVYYILFVILTIAIIFNSSIGIVKKIIFLGLALVYPYIINPILHKIYGSIHSMYKQLPKNVYNDL
jgi:hypothetical protein